MTTSSVLPSLHLPGLRPSFRQEIVPHVFQAICGGWSVALVGLPGVGMSNLLRFVSNPTVVRAHVSDAASSYLLVYVDANLVRDYTESDLARAVIESSAQAARQYEWSEHDLGPLLEAARHFAEYERQMTGMGVLVRIADILCRERRKRIVLVMDGFDEAFVRLPIHVLRGLRAVRDSHKQWLSFLVGTRVELSRLAARRDKGDGDAGLRQFGSLFEHHTFGLGPYCPEDASNLISSKSLELDKLLSPDDIDALIRLTGGYASLLMAGLRRVLSRHDMTLRSLSLGLARDAEVTRCCQDIWDCLDVHEHLTLIQLASDQRQDLSLEQVRLLRVKGLVVGHPPFLFSELYEAFVRRCAESFEVARASIGKSAGAQELEPSVIRNPAEDKRW